jgi:hypothetical protein
MSAAMIAAPVIHARTTLGEALAPLHEQWLADVQRVLGPALLGTATLWDRWTAVRYLVDQFAGRLEQERKLARRVPRLDRDALERIETGYDTLERLRAQIDAAGRHRHTGGLVMLLLQRFLELLAEWCAAIEWAAARVPVATLAAEAVQILTDLQAQASPAELCT